MKETSLNYLLEHNFEDYLKGRLEHHNRDMHHLCLRCSINPQMMSEIIHGKSNSQLALVYLYISAMLALGDTPDDYIKYVSQTISDENLVSELSKDPKIIEAYEMDKKVKALRKYGCNISPYIFSMTANAIYYHNGKEVGPLDVDYTEQYIKKHFFM